MKFDESQNATNNTSFSDDQLSDQSVTTARNSARKLRNTENLHRNLQLHQKPPLLPRKTKRTKELKTSPNKTLAVRRELHFTEQNLKRTVENVTTPSKTR